jgi:hypothetical protein
MASLDLWVINQAFRTITERSLHPGQLYRKQAGRIRTRW